jgi:integrase
MAKTKNPHLVNILKQIKVNGSWRRVPVLQRKGRIVWDNFLVGGKEEIHKEGSYLIEWTDTQGKRVREGVGSIPSDVLEKARIRSATLKAQRDGVTVTEQIVKHSSPENRVSLQKAKDRFLRDVEMNKSKVTHRRYGVSITDFLASTTLLFIDEVTREEIMNYMAYLYAKGNEASTVTNRTAIILSWLKTFGVGKVNPLLAKSDWPEVMETEPHAYSLEELTTFFAACRPEERDLFHFFLHTGFRDNEVRVAEWTDIDIPSGTIKVKAKPEYDFWPKGKCVRVVPVPDALLVLLRARRKHVISKLIFPSPTHIYQRASRSGGKLNAHFLDMCKAVALRAHLNCGDCENKRGDICATMPCCKDWYLHRFRDTFATQHLRSHVDIVTLSKWLGHKNVKTTMRYLEPARTEQVRDQVNSGLLAGTFR